MEAATKEFGAYWAYEIAPGIPSGIWSLDVRIDGAPAGSHSFELIVPQEPAPALPTASMPSPDEIYRSSRNSVVWIHKLNESGRRMDTGSGFVMGPNQIATAFQTIDAATTIEVEFEDGRKVTTDELWSWNRLQDWALVKADTGSATPLRRGEASKLPVADRLMVFNVEANLVRAFGGIDLAGRRTERTFGERLQLSPAVSNEAVGGPLFNPAGEVVGILGGSTFPGARIGKQQMSISPALYTVMSGNNRATPIELVRVNTASTSTLTALRSSRILSTPVTPMPSFLYGSTSIAFRGANDSLPPSVSEFSRKDSEIWVYSLWQRRDKVSRGIVSAEAYDASNHMVVKVKPKKISIPANVPMRHGFPFSPQTLEAGAYRVDLLFDDRLVWRTFFLITD